MPGIAVVGHLCVDLTPALPGPPVLEPGVLSIIGPARLSLGGAVANTGRTLAALGEAVTGWAAVGPDEFGRITTGILDAVPGFTFHPQVTDVASAYTIVIEPPGRDRTFWHHPGANAALDLAQVSLEGCDAVHVGYPSLLPGVCADSGAALTGFLAGAAGRGVVTSLDLAWVDPLTAAGRVDWAAFLRGVLPVTDVLSPSYDDLVSALRLPAAYDPGLAAELVERLLGWGAGIVLLTAGERPVILGAADADRLVRLGPWGLAPGEWAGARLTVPAPAVRYIGTTTGAGDAATAGLLVALRAGLGPQAAAEFATRVAAAVIEQGGTGAFTGFDGEEPDGQK